MPRTRTLVVASCCFALALTPAVSAEAKPAKTYENCTALHKKYPHGVARKGARDKVTSGKPVTTFKVNTKVYNAQKKGSDRDHDGVACEKR